MSTVFDTAFSRVIGNEGGYVNSPNDPGGETKWGISKRSYPNLDIANLTQDDAKAIYLRDYWGAGHFDALPPTVAFQAFDIAVNSGVDASVRMLQRAAGVTDDGVVGPITLAAFQKTEPVALAMRLMAERLDFWRKLPTWSNFGSGWAGRAATDLRYCAEDVTA